jgi:hypothetical protein
MMGAPRDIEAVVRGILKTSDAPLATSMEAAIGVAPTLDLISQAVVAPPHPPWVSPPLRRGAPLLRRRTAYRAGPVRLSTHLAYVDVGRLGHDLSDALLTGRFGLLDVLDRTAAEKTDHGTGVYGDAPDLDEALSEGFGDSDHALYVWRKYAASIRGRPTFVVIEALPLDWWEKALGATGGTAPVRTWP